MGNTILQIILLVAQFLVKWWEERERRAREAQARVLSREEANFDLRKAVAEKDGEKVTRFSRVRVALARELLRERRLRKAAPSG